MARFGLMAADRLARRRDGSGQPVQLPVLLPVLLAAAVSLLAACTVEPPEVTVDDPELVSGRAIWARSCASCHGAEGGGGVGPKLSDGAAVASFPTIEEQIALVAEGRNNMPAFGDRLSEEEQRAVARYIREIL